MADKIELQRRYQQHAIAMSNALKEAREHIQAQEEMVDETPQEMIAHIDHILQMVGTAHYHAHRLLVYRNLMYPKQAVPVPPERTADRASDWHEDMDR
jgi:hypothetical protein